VVVEDLRARAARAGVAHLPEVVAFEFAGARLVADADAALLGTPISLVQMSNASSSVSYTVVQSLSGERPYSTVRSSHAYWIASRLK
jgi:hypothetical protein